MLYNFVWFFDLCSLWLFSDLVALSFELYYYNNYIFTYFPRIIITSDKTEETSTKGFEKLNRTLLNDAFFKTIDGLLIFMMDNCDELPASIKMVWPKATLLLCNFHILPTTSMALQQVWRWLYEKEHGICKDNRAVIMKKHMKKHSKI